MTRPMLRIILLVACVAFAVVGAISRDVRWASASLGCLGLAFLTEA